MASFDKLFPSAFHVRPFLHSVSLFDCRAVSNGAFLMPNTFMMQELVRSAVDQYIDDMEQGFSIECPVVFTISKGASPLCCVHGRYRYLAGTPVPNSLALVREHTSRFSLQPYEPNLLSGNYIIHLACKAMLTLQSAQRMPNRVLYEVWRNADGRRMD